VSSRKISKILPSFTLFEKQHSPQTPRPAQHPTMAALPPYALAVSPESSLQFTITQHPQGDGDENNASRCVLTLKHTGATKESLAFKVRESPGPFDIIAALSLEIFNVVWGAGFLFDGMMTRCFEIQSQLELLTV
jgi:hypothetical protein